MDKIVKLVMLSVMQGVFEWLPVSSSGIVTVLGVLTGYSLSEAYSFALSLHLASAAAAAIIFRRRIAFLLRSFAENPGRGEHLWYAVAIAVSAAIGGPITVFFSQAAAQVSFETALIIIGVLLLITSAATRYWHRYGGAAADDPGPRHLLLAGVAQGLAALPGLSRSGLVLGALAAARVKPAKAYEVAMIIGIPVLAAAGLYGLASIWGYVEPLVYTGLFALTFILNIVVGYVLLRMVSRLHVEYFTVFVATLLIVSGLLALIA